MKRTLFLLLIMGAVALLLTRDANIHAQDQSSTATNIADWFCAQNSPNALGASSTVCFQLSNVELLVPQYHSLYFTSSDELQLSTDDWVRLCQFAAERHAWNGITP